MEKYINPITPISALTDNRISSLEKLLLMHIISLCKQKGYCWATNSYFMDIYGYSKQTISKSINKLASLTYINLNYDNEAVNNSKRTITLSEVLNKTIQDIQENFNTGMGPKFKQYNKNNINKIYYKDNLGNEYWNGTKISNKEATKEEQEELERLLKEFK